MFQNRNKKLSQAKDLIKQGRFQEARDLIASLPNSADKRRWLKQIDDHIELANNIGDIANKIKTDDNWISLMKAGAEIEDIKKNRSAHLEEEGRKLLNQPIVTPPQGVQQWEYCRVFIGQDVFDVDIKTLEITTYSLDGSKETKEYHGKFLRQVIARLGLEGWEMVLSNVVPNVKTRANYHIYIFKRPLP